MRTARPFSSRSRWRASNGAHAAPRCRRTGRPTTVALPSSAVFGEVEVDVAVAALLEPWISPRTHTPSRKPRCSTWLTASASSRTV